MSKIETNQYYAIALRGVVPFPGTSLHFDIGREKSLTSLQKAMSGDGRLFLICQKDPEEDDPGREGLFDMGCVARIKQVMPLPDSTVRVLVEPECRARLVGIFDNGDCLSAEAAPLSEEAIPSGEDSALLAVCKQDYQNYLNARGETGGETKQLLLAQTDAASFADRLAHGVIEDYRVKQQILECSDPEERAIAACVYLRAACTGAELEQKIHKEVQSRMDRNNREYWLREQQRVIEEELGEDDDGVALYEKKLKNLPMDKEARERTEKEIRHLKRSAPQSPEAAVMENYIEYMLELPWGKFSAEKIDIARARRILNEDHYGLKEVKQRILEFLAVRSIKPDGKSPILCLVGAPGVGKTSIARSIARALKREFCQVALGGVHDEAELRGHRRTYVAAMPGRVISAIKQCGSMNPVFLFDEIDKMAADMRGDPASAMLEVLDPEQNDHFRDHYLEAPFDLSRVLFITTANTAEAIPKPLYDRMEVIEVPSYTVEEKKQIAKRHLWKKQLNENAMEAENLKITDAALTAVIEQYTAEAGVRTLERTLGRVIRKAAVERLETPEEERKPVRVTPAELAHYLGAPKYLKPEAGAEPEVGAVNGLAWTAVGGVVMPIEVAVVPGSGALELTGSLGDVMKESAKTALTFVRRHMEEDGVTEEFRKAHDIHIHVPEGATPKDGPSAGIAMACAIYSALTGLPARQDVAMTGEISLRGKALPIGGGKEKLLAAYRMGIKNVLLPRENMKDLEEIPDDILGKMNVVPMTAACEALRYVLPGKRA